MFKILKKEWLSEQICLMDIEAPLLASSAKPGQFLIVKIDEKSERVPLTICDFDTSKGTVTLVFLVLGSSTKKMGYLEIGDYFQDVVGPLGQPSEFLDEDISDLKKKKFLFVAGGIGAAPIYPQLKWFKENGIEADVIVGAKTKDIIILEEEMRKVSANYYPCTDDGTYGFHGLVTNKIDELITKEKKHYDHIVAIGPMIMMKFTVMKAKEYNIPTVVSLNPLMIDGTGMCGACRVTIDNKIKFACVDGPEFDGYKVNFDEAMRRQNIFKSEEGKKYLENIEKDTHHSSGCQCHEEPECTLEPKGNSNISTDKIIVDRKKKVPIREQSPIKRITNFDEVTLNYTLDEAMAEASRCLECKNPLCVNGCPVSINIPAFISEIKNGKILESGQILKTYTSLPAVCGRVCPQETQCEEKCILGIKGEAVAIGKLEKFVGDYLLENPLPTPSIEKNGHKVAVIGSGPSGLTAAGDLAKMGYEVIVYEALHKLGGVLTYGIPEFRLPKEKIVQKEIDAIADLGVTFITNVVIGKTITIDTLLEKEDFKAIFIGSGAGLPNFMGIPGENLNGVYSANEFLTRINLMKSHLSTYDTPFNIGKSVAVIGGGNVAMDAVRTARRLGFDSHILYRRGEKEFPARSEELHHAKEEGILVHELTLPKEVIGNEKGEVIGIKCIKTSMGEPDSTGRRQFSEVENSEFILDVDTVIMAIGTSPNPLISQTTKNLEINKRHCIVTDEWGNTSRKGIFAGGDISSGASTVILAMEAGKKSAIAIDKFIKENI